METPAQGLALPILPEDEADFSDLFGSHRPELIKMLIYMGATADQADDAVQKAFEELWKNWKSVRKPEQWVKQAVKTNFYKIKNQLRREPLLVNRDAPDAKGLDDHLPPVEDDDLQIWEDQQWIEQMLATLKPSPRRTMELILAEFSRHEIAEALGCTEGALRQRLLAARRQLKKAFSPDYEVVPSSPRTTSSGKEAQ